jgi:hypothetical protein
MPEDIFEGCEAVIWNLTTAARTASFALETTVSVVAFSPDSRSVLVGDEAGGLFLYPIPDP